MNMNNRKMRKLGSRDESGISQQSILSAMDRFVIAVDNMNETVMVPSRLMDMSPVMDHNDGSLKTTKAPLVVSSPAVDLFGFFNMLNSVKNELIWGGNANRTTVPPVVVVRQAGGGLAGVPPPPPHPFLSRRNSTVSSMSLSDDSEPDTESCSESDSSLEYEPEVHSSVASRNFRHHLNGLYQALQQLTDSADILTDTYQNEVGGTS